MDVPFWFVQMNRVVCDACGAADVQSWHLLRGQQLIMPSLPAGWFQIGRKVLCDAHNVTVSVKIDGTVKPEDWTDL